MIHRPLIRLFDQLGVRLSFILKTRRHKIARSFLHMGTEKPETYQYDRLSTTPKQIRLLKISSSIWSASCELVVFNYESSLPKYEAISWRWLSDQKTRSLQLGDGVIHINTSIFDILSELTPNLGVRYFWLDYICINQRDDTEKANQIPLMAAIYRGAARAIAYIGDGEGSHLVPDFLAELESHIVQRMLIDEFPNMDRTDHFPFRNKAAEWRALLTMVNNDIWARAWIIQGQFSQKTFIQLDRMLISGQKLPSPNMWSCYMEAN
jgi:hypothetical protein